MAFPADDSFGHSAAADQRRQTDARGWIIWRYHRARKNSWRKSAARSKRKSKTLCAKARKLEREITAKLEVVEKQAADYLVAHSA